MKTIWRPAGQSADLNFQQDERTGATVLFSHLPDRLQGMPLVVQEILQRRGVLTTQELENIVDPKLSSLRDPFSILGMSLAVSRLVQAFVSQEKICIYADFDLDGTSGLALLRDGLLGLGFKNIQYYQPKRLSEGYGFHPQALDELATQGVSLVVTVDVGITANQACKRAKELGIDVVLTDHHQPSDILPEAFVILNPNQKDCSSDLKYLCGAGVAFYLLRAVKRGLVDQALITESTFDLRSVLDCLTIATVTDMVPIRDDNRTLVRSGLKVLAATSRPGLRALLESLGLAARPLSSQDVAIRFAPKLNALSRMELGLLPIDLYLITDMIQAAEAVKKVLKNNQTRVNLQMDGENEAFAALERWPYEGFSAVASASFHRGVVGLIATKLAQAKNQPAFVGSIDEEGRVVGSARTGSDNEVSVLDALASCSACLDRFGGHHAAAGFELRLENWPKFLQSLNEHFINLGKAESVREIFYDAEIEPSSISESLLGWMDAIGPFGQGFSVPTLRLRQVKFSSFKEITGGHWKFVLQSQDGEKKFEALWFSPPKSRKIEFEKFEGIYEILGEVQWNYFAGRKSVQILLKEMRKANAS